MKSQTQLLIDKWPLFPRVFFVLFGIVLALISTAAAAGGDVLAAMVMLLLSLLLESLCFLENRALLDVERKEVILHFQWLFRRRNRHIPQSTIAHVYVRVLGKGREVGLQLTDGSEVPLCQPMGYESDKQELAKQIADRIGVQVVQIPFQDGPVTNSQLLGMNIILHAFAGAFGFVAWLAAKKPSTEGDVAWPAVLVCCGVATLILASTWQRTIREIRERGKG